MQQNVRSTLTNIILNKPLDGRKTNLVGEVSRSSAEFLAVSI